MNKIVEIVIFLLIAPCLISFGQSQPSYKTFSPDKTTSIEVRTDDDGKLMYRTFYSGKEVITWSALGFVVNNITAGEQTKIKAHEQRTHKEKIPWRLGEDDTLTNYYNETTITCQSSSLSFNLIARVYDGSVAFRYELLSQSGTSANSIRKENTGFRFAEAFTLYQYNQESVFTPVSIDTFNKPCDFPATLTNQKLFISIGEANNTTYTKAELKRGSVPHYLTTTFPRDSVIKFEGHYLTPWRIISVSSTAIGLHRYSQLYLKLNPAAAKGIPTWIKPGKLIRSQLNTQSGVDCIDFAAKHHFQYIMFDAGWYGAEFRGSSDPTKVIPEIDMPKVIQYGKQKGVGIILYVNYVGLKAKLDTILPLFKTWGVSGIKFGFVDGVTQTGLTWLSSAIKKTTDYGFILDIHDNYKPTGLSRTFPALLTQEGIRGDENSPDAFHTTLLPFTRFLAGPADFTFCYPNEKNTFSKNLKVSKGHQLALTVVYFSPLQAMFWYGQPKDYTNEGEIEFFKYVPTVWNESHYLAGEIGKNISVARRNGHTWFVGNAAGPIDWQQIISLDFLSSGKTYTATMYEDDGQGGIRKKAFKIKKGDAFTIDLPKETGQAIMIEDVNK